MAAKRKKASKAARASNLGNLQAEYQALVPLAANFADEVVRQLKQLIDSSGIALGSRFSHG